jgi:hypothetical protein
VVRIRHIALTERQVFIQKGDDHKPDYALELQAKQLHNIQEPIEGLWHQKNGLTSTIGYPAIYHASAGDCRR